MRLSGKRIVVLLLAVAFCSGAASLCAAAGGSGEGARSLLDPNDDGGAGELFFRMMLMVLLVIVLGAAAIYLSRKVLPGFTQLSGKRVRVVETVHLGPRKALHLVRIGNRQLLIGGTNENITRLADVTDALSEADSPVSQIENNTLGSVAQSETNPKY
ncbi:MAG: flagellar biosynthetic protein FliO [Planctomycetota bacterium]|nr:MAG: flagellar biosynthetic protein FliO [Planctomycetota bacterium]